MGACSCRPERAAGPAARPDIKQIPSSPSSEPALAVEFEPAKRRDYFLLEQARFTREVENTRARREAERVLQCQCPACARILGIRAGQLLASGGVVRCGRCATLFIVRVQVPGTGGLALPPAH